MSVFNVIVNLTFLTSVFFTYVTCIDIVTILRAVLHVITVGVTIGIY